ARREVHTLAGRPLDLADIVGGGDGRGTGKDGFGIDPRTGKEVDRSGRGFLSDIAVNTPRPGPTKFVQAVFVPHGPGDVPVTTTGLSVPGLPATSRAAWDAIRKGPVNQQHSTRLGDVDYAGKEHTILGLHANAGITFDVGEILARAPVVKPVFRAVVGYGGTTPTAGAEYFVFVDGGLRASGRIGRDDGGTPVDVPLADGARFLTLVATDGGNGIGMDQIFFGDARIEGAPPSLGVDDRRRLEDAERKLAAAQRELESLAPPGRVFGPQPESAPPVRVNIRGNPEALGDEIAPGSITAVSGLPVGFGDSQMPEGERRRALATWVTAPANPLTPRVIVNRLWHHHFGTGLVDTPSDVGLGGGRPSHPELLDWLAAECVARGWRLKAMHRLICTSHTYRQASAPWPDGLAVDALDRLLWRHPPRRLEAEAIRDAILAVSGSLDTRMGGPGFDLFEANGNYVKVYVTKEAFGADEFRRMVYQSKPRAELDTFFGAFDCPDASQVQPRRTASTTPLQALNMLNGTFLLDQSGRFASRVEREAGVDPDRQVTRAFFLALGRLPTPAEAGLATALVREHGLALACRSLYNANEFITVR
ncbi:MAG: DUF1553 domain-containing protein, partial [Planctomycetota bacterium]